MHRQVRIAPALHQRQRERLLVLDLWVAREQRRRDGRVGLGLAVRERVDRVVEVGDGDLGAGRADQCRQQHRQVFQRLMLHRFPVHPAVQVRLVRVDGHARVDHPAHPERQAGDVVV